MMKGQRSPYFENAAKILPCRVDPQSTSRDDQLAKVVQNLCPSFLEATSEKPVFEPLTGGLSNELFVWKRDTTSILFRIHPSSSDSNARELIDREVENKILAMLSSQGDAPLFFGRFQNGRVEEFYNDHVPLTCHEMKDHESEIGKLMARLHNQKVPATVLEPSRYGDVWDRVDEWIEIANESLKAAGQHNSATGELMGLLSDEWRWTKSKLLEAEKTALREESMATRARSFASHVVLAHMDCQSLNILRPNKEEGPLRLIDFEYSGFNPRGVDIANTFCEHCDMNNLKADWVAEYPSEKSQNEFLTSYLNVLDESPCKGMTQIEIEGFLEQLRLEIGRYTLVSHLGWAVWGVANAQLSEINFDYIKYSRHRLDGYIHFRRFFFDS